MTLDIGTIVAAATVLFGTPAFVASAYYGYRRIRRDIEEGAYAKAKAEMVLKEATATIDEKDKELATKDQALAAASVALSEASHRERRLEVVADEQRSIIDHLSRALDTRGGQRESAVIS